MPASYPQPCQDDRKRTSEAWPRKEAKRSDLTVSMNNNSGLERESTLQNIQTMDTSSNMGNSACVDGGYGMPLSLSHADQPEEQHAMHRHTVKRSPSLPRALMVGPGYNRGAPPSANRRCCTWREPPPPTSENPRPNARPMPGPRQLTRVNLSATQNCSSAYSSEPTCHRPQIRSIDDPLSVPRDQTVPDDAQNPPPDAQPMPAPQHLPRVDQNSTQHFNSAGSSVGSYRRQFGVRQQSR